MIQVPLWLIISLAFLVSASVFGSGMTPSALLGPVLCYMLVIISRLVQLMQAPLRCAAACCNLPRPRPPPLPDPSLSTVSQKLRGTHSLCRFNTCFMRIGVLMYSLQLVSASAPGSFTSAVSFDWYFSSAVCVDLLWLYPIVATSSKLLARSFTNPHPPSLLHPLTLPIFIVLFLCAPTVVPPESLSPTIERNTNKMSYINLGGTLLHELCFCHSSCLVCYLEHRC